MFITLFQGVIQILLVFCDIRLIKCGLFIHQWKCVYKCFQRYQIIKIQNFKISRNVKLREVNMMMISNIPPLLFVDQIAIGYSVLCERDQLLVYWDIHGKTSCPNLPSAQCFVQITFDFPASTISKTSHEIPIQVYFVFAMEQLKLLSPPQPSSGPLQLLHNSIAWFIDLQV